MPSGCSKPGRSNRLVPATRCVQLPTEWQWEAALRAATGTDRWPGCAHTMQQPAGLPAFQS